ncbi:MAG: hypothetical protein V3V78_01765 [Candidatus Woesearchaeota archaeon]
MLQCKIIEEEGACLVSCNPCYIKDGGDKMEENIYIGRFQQPTEDGIRNIAYWLNPGDKYIRFEDRIEASTNGSLEQRAKEAGKEIKTAECNITICDKPYFLVGHIVPQGYDKAEQILQE